MEPTEFAELAESALNAQNCVVAFAECEVSYSGRAETSLGRGSRMIVIKSDKSVLIHQPEGTTPVNYMKGGTHISFERVQRHVILHCFNQQEKAWMDIEIFRVFDAIKERLEDGQKLDLAGNEKDMSDWIRDNPASISKDFKPTNREEQTDVGFIDVFGHDGQGNLIVIECKRVTASLSAVDQLDRYVGRVKKIKGTENVLGFLAAPGITPNALTMLQSRGFTFVKIEPPKRLERWQKHQKNLSEF